MNYKKYPKQDEVEEVNIGNNRINIVKITDENKEHLLEAVMNQHIGEPCRICGDLIKKDDLNDLVFAGYSKNNEARSAHKDCWDKYPATDNVVHPMWLYQ